MTLRGLNILYTCLYHILYVTGTSSRPLLRQVTSSHTLYYGELWQVFTHVWHSTTLRETIKSVTTTSKRTFIAGGPLLIKMQIYVYLMYLRILVKFCAIEPTGCLTISLWRSNGRDEVPVTYSMFRGSASPLGWSGKCAGLRHMRHGDSDSLIPATSSIFSLIIF